MISSSTNQRLLLHFTIVREVVPGGIDTCVALSKGTWPDRLKTESDVQTRHSSASIFLTKYTVHFVGRAVQVTI